MKGHVDQWSKGSWTIVYDLPSDGSPKRKQKSETFRGITKKQAEQKLRDRLTALDNGSYIPLVKETVARFLEKWMETYAATNTNLRTQRGYRQYIRKYIVPAIGHVELQKVTPAQIQAIYSQMLGKGLSHTTVTHLHRILHKALATAVKWGMLARNPTEAVTAPRLERKQMEMWNVDTTHRFLEAAQESRFCDIYHLAIFTGMRRSELCGLKWENVDLVAGRLSVVNTLQRLTDHGLVEGQPKTARSRRTIALPHQAVDLLHAIRGRQMEQQLEAGPLWENTGYVFTQATGSPLTRIC
jgi:integrase